MADLERGIIPLCARRCTSTGSSCTSSHARGAAPELEVDVDGTGTDGAAGAELGSARGW
jgi:hypothetical protein